MTTKRTVVFESFVTVGSFDYDHTHMSLLTCPPLPYQVANLTMNSQMYLVIFDLIDLVKS
jgi:hypothetical protein